MEMFKSVPGSNDSQALMHKMLEDSITLAQVSISVGPKGVMITCGCNETTQEVFTNLCGEEAYEHIFSTLSKIASSQDMQELCDEISQALLQAGRQLTGME